MDSKRRERSLPLRRTLARRVRKLRARHRLTQELLAERTGLAPRHIQKIEAGEVNATLDTLVALAEALEVTVTSLLAAE